MAAMPATALPPRQPEERRSRENILLKQFLIIACAAIATACGGGGDATDNLYMQQVDKQKIAPPATASFGTDRTVYGDVLPSPTQKISWVELIGLQGTIDFTAETTLRNLIDGTGGRTPLAEMLRGGDPSTFMLLSYGHQEALFANTRLEEFKDALREAVAIARARGRTPEIRGLHHVTGFEQPILVRRDQFDRAARDVAAELGVRFYDVGSLPWTPEDLMPDGYHPTVAYSSRIGAFLRSQMQ